MPCLGITTRRLLLKRMVVSVCSMFRNNFFIFYKGCKGGGGALNKLNHTMKQPYNKSEHYLILGGAEGREVWEINFLKAKILPTLVSKQ